MRGRARLGSALIPLALVLLSAAPLGAQEGAEKVYRQAVEAIEKRRWAEAIGLLRQAIAIAPTEAPGRGGIFGLFGGRDYIPHVLLGRALAERQDCTGALIAWEDSDRQRVARTLRNGEYGKEIDNGYQLCEARGFLPAPKFQRELDDARAAVRAAAEEGRRLAEHVSPYDDSIKTAHRKQVTGAESRMQVANAKLTSGEQTRRAQDFTDAKAAAATALREFQASRGPLDILIKETAAFLSKVTGAESAANAAEQLGRDIDTLLRGPVKVVPSESARTARARADAQVTSARERLRTARSTQTEAPLTEANTLIAGAETAYKSVRGEIESAIRVAVDRELQLLQTQMQNTLTGLEARASDIEAALSTQSGQPAAARPAKELEAAQRGLSRARQAFDRAMRVRNVVDAKAALALTPRLAAQLDTLAEALAVAAPTLPGELRAAAEAFFDGKYDTAVQLLSSDQASAIDQRFRIHGHIVRAAALFALYQRSGGADASLRDQAQREVDQSRAIDPSFEPNPAAFSPRFLSFFRGVSPRPPQ